MKTALFCRGVLPVAALLALVWSGCGDSDDDEGSSASVADAGAGGGGADGSTSGCGTLVGACFNPALPDDPDSRAACVEYSGVPSTTASAFQRACEEGEATTWYPGQRCQQLESALNFGCETALGAGQGCSTSWGEVEAESLGTAQSACTSTGSVARP